MSDTAPPKVDPESLVLRASPRRVVRFKRNLLIGIAGLGFLGIVGATWLAQYTHTGAAVTFRMAVLPFIPGNMFKVAAASGIFTALGRWRRN